MGQATSVFLGAKRKESDFLRTQYPSFPIPLPWTHFKSAHFFGMTAQESLFWAAYMTHEHLRGSLNDFVEHAVLIPQLSLSPREGLVGWGLELFRDKGESSSVPAFSGRVFSGYTKESSRMAKDAALV